MVEKRYKLPDVISGYEVFEGLISFARPSTYALNLIKNPRMWNTTGYIALDDTSINHTHDEQYRGLFSLYCSGSTGSYNGIGYELSLVSGQKYKFSVDIKAQANKSVYIYLSTGATTPNTATIIKSDLTKGRWQRINWEFSAPSTGSFSVIIATSSAVPFYTDGWVIFASEDLSGEPENYFDGDTPAFSTLADFTWAGGRDTSYSVRRSGSGASGGEVFLSDLGFVVQGTKGLGKNPIKNIAIPLPTGGGYYQDTIPSIRNITIAGKVFAESRTEFMSIRRKLIDLFKPDRTPVKQEMLMRIYNLDGRNNTITPILESRVIYVSGLEGSYVSDFSESIQLNFVQYNQIISEDKDNAVEIPTSIVSSEGIDYVRGDGEVDEILLASDFDLNIEEIRAITQSQSGELYIGGTIKDSAATNYRHVIKYDGASWSRVGTGYGNADGDIVYCIKEFMAKYIAIGGDNATASLKIYNRVTESMTTYPSSPPTGGAVYALGKKNPTLYVGGSFTLPYNYLAVYDLDTDAWSELHADKPNGAVRCILLSGDESKLFVAGDFTAIGVTSYSKIAYYDLEEDEWVGMGAGLGGNVYNLAEGLDGTIYACGAFTTIQDGSANATYVARFRWQDIEWSALENESTWNSYASGVLDSINAINVSGDGALFLGGNRTNPVSYANLPKTSIFKYINNSTIVPMHVLCNTVYALSSSPDGGVYVGSSDPTSYATNEVEGFSKLIHLVTNLEVENATTYPEIHVRGPGTLFAIENHTTKQMIYFNSFPLLKNERLIIQIDPVIGLTLKGIASAELYLSAGSDSSFSLTPGVNKISISFEPRFEFLGSPSYETELQGFVVAGLNAENTNNGEHFYIDHAYDVVSTDITVQFLDHNSNVLAEGSIASPYGAYVTLNEINDSGVSGSVWVEGDTSNYQAEVAVGLVSLSWKNRRWSISEESE